MKVWITGANGFIGRHLARALADAGHDVHGVGHGALEENERNRVGLAFWLNGEIDGTNLNALAVRSGIPSLVFHLAGGSSVSSSIAQPYEDFFRTVVSTARLLEWLRTSAPECRLVSVSSAAVYGAEHEGPISEEVSTLPMSPYGEHKLIMEQLCRSYANTYGLRASVTRLFSVYGPNLRKQLLWDLCSRLHNGDRTLLLGGTGAEIRDWTDVRDVCRFLALVSEEPQSEPFEITNVGSGIGTSVADVATMVASNWSRDIAVKFSGISREGDPFSLVSNSARVLVRHFRWQIPIAQGIGDYVSWFREKVR